MKVYESKIIDIGGEAATMLTEKMMITFGENAPAELAEFCFIVATAKVKKDIVAGMKLLIGDKEFAITAVGDVVSKNLNDLGHITYKFDGAKEAKLGGTLYLEDKELPDLKVGTQITIVE